MLLHTKKRSFRILLPLLLCFFLSGCSPGGASGKTELYTPGKTSVLVPEASGEETLGGDPLLMDISNRNQGYCMALLNEEGKKAAIQIIGPDGVTYKYFLEEAGVYAVFPLTAGDGDYLILAYENVGGDQYASLFSQSITVELDNEFLPFLYPNQYVDFDETSEAVALAAQLSADAETDLDALTGIYEYLISHLTYDNEKAENVQSNYLPDVDSTLKTGTGICFDYASLMAAMLRSLGIPTKLEIGYSASIRHAWVDVYIESVGWVEHAVEFNGDEWKLMDPTFASTGKDDPAMADYIGDGENYTVQYIR